MLADTKIRLRLPEGVSASYWNLASADTDHKGRFIPIGRSYNGTIAITIANTADTPLTIAHDKPAAIVVINVADAELRLQASQDIFTNNSAQQFKKQLYAAANKTCDTMRGWRFLLHTNPSVKPVGSIITPLLKNTPCFTWALSPAGEHSFAFFQAKLLFSPKSEQIGKTGESTSGLE